MENGKLENEGQLLLESQKVEMEDQKMEDHVGWGSWEGAASLSPLARGSEALQATKSNTFYA